MTGILNTLGMGLDLALVIFGFGLIIFIHELGHFVAARWAGIRVLAFAIGFGPAAASYRRGMGFRRGSSEREYFDILRREREGSNDADPSAISPTEYRFNWLPLGGYVKMLGQEDLNPGAVSQAPDSYQNTKPWKRMVVISAGVIANIITAAVLFVLVYTIGIQTEPAKVGGVALDSPAANAIARNAQALGVDETGLRAGDEILSINGEEPNSFNDLVLAVAMARGGDTVEIVVQREGFGEPLAFDILPEPGGLTGLLEIGVEPARSAMVMSPVRPSQVAQMRELLALVDLDGVEPGMELVAIGDDETITGPDDLRQAIRASDGRPLELVFSDGSNDVHKTIQPEPDLQLGFLDGPKADSRRIVEHVLGLQPLMRVLKAEKRALGQGLRDGDEFLRIGEIEFPSPAQGMGEIRRNAGKKIPITVLRRNDDGSSEEVELMVSVSGGKTPRVGFLSGDTADLSARIARPPEQIWAIEADAEGTVPSAARLSLLAGSTIEAIAGVPVENFGDIREALRNATREAWASGAESATVALDVSLALPAQDDGALAIEHLEWTIARADLQELHDLSWHAPFGMGVFDLEQKTLKGSNPIESVGLGLHETKRVMLTTYVTFARLFQGTVKVEHLKGPVGIAHLGTRIAERGFIWLLFFLALVSVNLAVINFLPLPIVDGGQFLMLVYEAIRGRAVPIGLQNALTLAGLALIGVLFVVVTYNDIVGLVAG